MMNTQDFLYEINGRVSGSAVVHESRHNLLLEKRLANGCRYTARLQDQSVVAQGKWARVGVFEPKFLCETLRFRSLFDRISRRVG